MEVAGDGEVLPADLRAGGQLDGRCALDARAALIDLLDRAVAVQVEALRGEYLAAHLESERVVVLAGVDVRGVAGVPDAGRGVVVRHAGRPRLELGQLDQRRDPVEIG